MAQRLDIIRVKSAQLSTHIHRGPNTKPLPAEVGRSNEVERFRLVLVLLMLLILGPDHGHEFGP